MKVRIRRIGIGSAFLAGLVLYGLVGLLIGVILAIVSTVDLPPGTDPNLIDRLGVWSIGAALILYGLVGGIAAAVAAALYNVAASLMGGIRVEIGGAVEPPAGAGGGSGAAGDG